MLWTHGLLLLAQLASAAPSMSPTDTLQAVGLASHEWDKIGSCSIDNLQIPLPSGLTLAIGQNLSKVTLGRGTQNYTCTQGVFVSAGAVANLYDASCIFKLSAPFARSSEISALLPRAALLGLNFPDLSNLPVTIQHYFISTPGASSGISPVFATVSDRVVLKRDAGVDAADPTMDVAYLKLIALQGQGNLAQTVYRLDTAGGQPPQSCAAEGQLKTVPYAAMYYFMK